jgi:Fe-S cluster biosynthesis and repair protein YggX
MTSSLLHCTFYDRLLPALEAPPVAGELGERIFQSVSALGWNAWIRTERIFMAQFDIDPASPQYERKRQAAITLFFFGPPDGPRMVACRKMNRMLPALIKPPFPGDLGMRIYETISQRGWALWPEQERILINHYNMSLVDPQSQGVLLTAMEEFFFGAGATLPEGWTPQAAAPSKGGPRK